MLKSLADRLAEAAAEWLHERVRIDDWGYARDREAADARTTDRREIPGHPPGARLSGLPRPHREEGLVRLLDAPANAGIDLTENFAMTPAAAVSGFYLAHPQAHYFAVTQNRPRPA